MVFLLFLIGLELSFERLLTMRRLVFGLGCLQVMLCTAVLGGIILAAGYKPAAAAIIGACLSLSSTAIVIEVLSNQRRICYGGGSRQLFHPAGPGPGRSADLAVRLDTWCQQRRRRWLQPFAGAGPGGAGNAP